ncbi:hypothetical protein SLS54_003944 [Diplodia seriata]
MATPPLICNVSHGTADLYYSLANSGEHMFKSSRTGEALLRRAVSLALVQHLLLSTCVAGHELKEQATVVAVVQHVAVSDPDTCRTTLESLTSTISASVLAAAAAADPAAHACIATILSAIADVSKDVEVAASVRHAFAELLGRGLVLPDAPHRLAPVMLGSAETRTQIDGLGSPSLHEGALPLLGRYIDARVASATSPSPTVVPNGTSSTRGVTTATATENQGGGEAAVQEGEPDLQLLLALFARTLRADLAESQPFPTRRAAIAALDTLRDFWRRRQQRHSSSSSSSSDDGDDISQHHLALALIAYDALNDDDDEIRDAAARVATRIVVFGGGDYHPHHDLDVDVDAVEKIPAVLPLAASAKLAAYLRRTYPASRVLCVEAARRLLLEEESYDGKGRSGGGGFAVRLAEARTENAALFAREKQNLFLDPVREVGVWGGVLAGLGLGVGGEDGDAATAAAVSGEVVRRLEGWCVDGLRELRLLAERERDGAMGWAGRGEVFLLGWRVVGAVRVVLGWKRRGVVVAGGEVGGGLVRKKRVGRLRSSEVRRLLRETVDTWVEADVHGLWVREAEEVLSESVVAKLVDVRGIVEAVVGRGLSV